MSDAAERIWIFPYATRKFKIRSPYGGDIAYVRDDIHAALEAENAWLRKKVTQLQYAYDLEITRPGRFPSCDCDDEDCVACSHYPTLVEQARKRLTLAALEDGNNNERTIAVMPARGRKT